MIIKLVYICIEILNNISLCLCMKASFSKKKNHTISYLAISMKVFALKHPVSRFMVCTRKSGPRSMLEMCKSNRKTLHEFKNPNLFCEVL